MSNVSVNLYNLILIFSLIINLISVMKLVHTTGFGKKEEWILKLHVLGVFMVGLDFVCISLRSYGITMKSYIFNAAFLYSYSMMGYIMAYYMLVLYLERFAYKLKFRIAFSIPAVVWLIVLIVSCHNKWLFKVDESGIQVNGLWFWGAYVVFGNAYYYALIFQSTYRIIVTRLRKRENTLPILFATPMIIGSTIQFLEPSYPGINMGMAITFFIVCINNVEAIYKRQKKISRVLENDAKNANADLQWRMDIQNIFTKNAVYTYEFDVTTGEIPEDIVDKNGVNYTKELGMQSPCSFDEIIPKSKVDSVASSIKGLDSIEKLNCKTLRKAYKNGQVAPEIECHYTTTGAYHRLTYMMSDDPLSDHIKALVVAHDVTVLKQREKLELAEKERRSRELEAALEASDRLGKAKTEFLFNMSHDIRTPMNAIIGYTELLENNLEDETRTREFIGKIKCASDFLLSLMNNVLEMAKIDYGKATLEEEPTNIESVANFVEGVISEDFRKKNIDLKININVKHYHVYADITKVREVLINLLSNALKYTEEGGHVSLNIDELAPKHDKLARFKMTVEDDGIGMSKEYIPQIFDEFSREKNTTQCGILGTGLGMPIVKKLLDLMNADIDIESEPGKGTKIVMTGEFRIIKDKDLKAEKEEKADSDNKYAGMRILLAEDNEMNAEIAIARLEAAGFEIEHAEDGSMCVKMMESRPEGYYDFVLMDIQMPKMNGYEATRAIRILDSEIRRKTPIFAVTANAFEEDKKNALDAGMNGHIAKPMKLADLMDMLDTVFK